MAGCHQFGNYGALREVFLARSSGHLLLWCNTKVTPEEKRRVLARRAQGTEQQRSLFNAEKDAEAT